MKRCAVLILSVALFFALSTSCTSMKSFKTVRAGYDAEEQDSWASRHIPGVKAISKFIPPPTDARRQWDERYKKWNFQDDSTGRYPDL